MIATHSVHLVALPFSRSIDVPNHECSKTHKCPVWSRVLAFSRCAAAVDCCLARAAHDRNQTSSAYPAARVSDCNMPGDESFPCSPNLPGPLPIRQDRGGLEEGARERRPRQQLFQTSPTATTGLQKQSHSVRPYARARATIGLV